MIGSLSVKIVQKRKIMAYKLGEGVLGEIWGNRWGNGGSVDISFHLYKILKNKNYF